MQIPLALADPVVIEEVSLPLWRELFDALGWPAGLSGKGDSLTHEEIMSAFQRDIPSDELLQAIESIHDLGTPEGREAISELLTDRQVPIGTLPKDVGERELAVHLFLAQRNNGALAEVFSRAQIQIHEGNQRRFNDFIGKKQSHIQNLPSKCEQLKQAILDHCQQEGLGSHVQLRVFDDDGAHRFQILRSHHKQTPMVVMDGTDSRAKIQFRPVHGDLIRYEPVLGRLRITARAASIVRFYSKIFGQVLFDDEMFFLGDPVCSLEVLQEKGRSALERHNVFGVGRVWMTECIWERGDRERLNFFHPHDCFESIESLNIPLIEGQLLQAKFKIQVIEKSSRPVTVTVRVPRQIEISRVRHEDLVNEVLDAIGIRNVCKTVPESDLWTLYPWRQPVDVWRNYFGVATDLLVTAGVLKKTFLDSVEPPGYPGAGRILHVEKISPTEMLGVSQTPGIPSKSLSATDLDGLELIVPAFQRYLREILGLKGNCMPWQSNSWLLDLGALKICEYEFRLVYGLRRPPSSDSTGEITNLSGSTAPILLMPGGMTHATGVTEILLGNALPERQRLIQDIIAKTNLEGRVPALLTAPERARLVVDSRLGKIWVDGIHIAGLDPGTHPFRFVELLAKSAPNPINKHDLASQLSESRNDGDQTARSAKTAANKKIKTALENEGRSFEDPFKSENGLYRLIILAHAPDNSSSG
ncbi:hypothetical protein [Zhongshania marina]|uniref:Uncharacterized protein n=1 Tax=Zhongshania marina TaxID=2304603 RepID=A0ABX9W3R2_9GAMM|nr:hypothetical protein D0911_08655 [Zhongshania marina]